MGINDVCSVLNYFELILISEGTKEKSQKERNPDDIKVARWLATAPPPQKNPCTRGKAKATKLRVPRGAPLPSRAGRVKTSEVFLLGYTLGYNLAYNLRPNPPGTIFLGGKIIDIFHTIEYQMTHLFVFYSLPTLGGVWGGLQDWLLSCVFFYGALGDCPACSPVLTMDWPMAFLSDVVFFDGDFGGAWREGLRCWGGSRPPASGIGWEFFFNQIKIR